MNVGKKLQQASAQVVKIFANAGVLIEPPANATYDTLTGDMKGITKRHPFEYSTVTDKTDRNTSLKASSFRESVIYFTVADSVIVNETWGIEGLNTAKWGILGLEKITVNDIIVGYYALIKVKQ